MLLRGFRIARKSVDARRHGKTRRVRFDFANSPPLPAYLVAFAAGPFDIVKAVGRTSLERTYSRGG